MIIFSRTQKQDWLPFSYKNMSIDQYALIQVMWY